MDPRLEKALSFSNYQKSLSIKRKTLKEKIDSKLTFAYNGGIFKIDRSLLVFVQMLIDQDRTDNVPLIDANENPILINDIIAFRDEIFSRYQSSILEYYQEFEKIKRSRSVEKLLDI